MKRFPIILVIAAIAGIAIYFLTQKTEQKPEEKQQAIQRTTNSADFNSSFGKMLEQYYLLKDALVAADTAKASKAAVALAKASNELKLEGLTGDSTGLVKETAKSFAGTISNSATLVLQANGLEPKRKEFETITDPLWSLTRTVRYDQSQVYYQYCPMAFDDRGAYWLSNNPEVRNPYFGDKMLKCGSVEDSLRLNN